MSKIVVVFGQFMKLLKTYGVPAGMLISKLLQTWLTGRDTLIATDGDLLMVALIDGSFLAMWSVTAYGGQSKSIMPMRPLAAGLAWALYLGMIVIGIEVHHSPAAVVARLTGAGLLLYDTWDYVTDLREKRRQTAEARRKHLYYHTMKDRTDKAINRAGKKLQAHMDTAVFERMREDAPDVILAVLGNSIEVPQNYRSKTMVTVEVPSATVVEGWQTVAGQLIPGASFKRAEVEAITGLARASATNVINHAIALGKVQKVGRGEYVYHNKP